MKVLVTGSAGHLGEALLHTFKQTGQPAKGMDLIPSEYTDAVGSICDRGFVHEAIQGCEAVIHTATLHKPHVGTHSRQDFVDTNISGTLNLLEEAISNNCQAFVYTSTTSTFGDAMKSMNANEVVWVNEDLVPKPKNIYGATKTAAEDLCQLFHRNTQLPCLVLKTSRFFPEEDDAKHQREAFSDDNLKLNELLFRRVDIADIVEAHRLALVEAPKLGFDKFIISATTPFQTSDKSALAEDTPSCVLRYCPEYADVYHRRGWSMFKTIDRVYDNSHARHQLGWSPRYTFQYAIEQLISGKDFRSDLTHQIGKKGYHSEVFEEGPYPVTGF